MGYFVFILMITLAVATTTPVYDLSYDEIVNTINSLKEENEQLKEENNILHASLDEATTNNNALQSSNEQCETELQKTKTTLDEATTNNNALQSSNEQCEKQLQNTKTTLDEATTNNNDLQSSKEQCETELKETNEELKTKQELQFVKSCGFSPTVPQPPVNMKDCTEVYWNGFSSDGVYTIKPENSQPLCVYCQGGWTVIQKRSDDSVNYRKNMEEYGRGFGQIDGEHWLGLDAMNKLTEQGSYTLRIELEAFDGETAWAEYSNFHVSPGTDYTLTFDKSSYRGTAGDSLSYFHNMKFTTYDVDQDEWYGGSCSTDRGDTFGGCGWWFRSCGYVLTAMEYGTIFSINWFGFKDHAPLKAAVMKIQRV